MFAGSRSAFVLVFFLLIPVCIPAQTVPPDSVDEVSDTSGRTQSAIKAFTEPVRLEHYGKLYSLARNWAFLPANNPRAATAPIDQLPFRSMSVPSQWHQHGVDYDGTAWYRIDFTIGEVLHNKDLAIALPYLVWAHQCYVNGRLIGEAGRIGSDGQFISGNAQPRAYHIPAYLLHREAGQRNMLAIRVRSYEYIGGFIGPDIYLGSAHTVLEKHRRSEVWTVFLCGMIFVVALTHVISYLGRRKERQYLLFSLLAFSATCITVGLSGIMFFLTDEMLVHLFILHYGITTVSGWLLLFFHEYFSVPHNNLMRVLIALSGGCLLWFAASLVYAPVFKYYSFYGVPAILGLILITFLYCFYLTVNAMRRNMEGARIVLIGFGLYAVATTNDVLSFLQFLSTARVHDEGLLAFIISMAVAVSLRFSRTHNQLESTYARLEESERRYRELIDKSTDMVFSLDRNGRITMINRAVRDYLGLSVRAVMGRHINDILYSEPQMRSLDQFNVYLMGQKIEEVLTEKNRVSFHNLFRTNLHEPRELDVEMEFMQTETGPVISGRARGRTEDEMNRMKLSEAQSYELMNYLSLAETLAHQIGLSLTRYMEYDDAMSLRLALREIIINAIEHGNLAITFDEKSAAQNEGHYFDLLRDRQADPRYRDRRVYIRYAIDARRARFLVRDQGAGFDHREMMSRRPQDLNEQVLMHGRGLLYAVSEFDSVTYNQVGNTVYLVKNFRP